MQLRYYRIPIALALEYPALASGYYSVPVSVEI